MFIAKSRCLDMEKHRQTHSVVLCFFSPDDHLFESIIFDVLFIDLEASEKSGSLSDPSGVSLSIWVTCVRAGAHGSVCGSGSRGECEPLVCQRIPQFHSSARERNDDLCMPSAPRCHVARRDTRVPTVANSRVPL